MFTETKMDHILSAVSPVDGRYQSKTKHLQDVFSEQTLIWQRVYIECAWLRILSASDIQNLPEPSHLITALNQIESSPPSLAASAIKEIESSTNHDVKAVEYWLQQQLSANGCAEWIPFIHFACTSEDINNLAYGRMLKNGLEQSLLPELKQSLQILKDLISTTAAMPMLARTHGQTASPTTMGKELCNFAQRLTIAQARLKACEISGKFNGAVGNFNAHLAAYPDTDWQELSTKMIATCGLKENKYTTQIEPHDDIAHLMQVIANTNTIIIDLCRDIWAYISLGYFSQSVKANEVGSSTMPHKVNPIDFENAEGNLGMANALALHFASKLPISRLQRDLSDSTVMRNLGVVFAYSSIAQQSLQKGLQKLQPNADKMLQDLEASPEVLAEAIQTCMRAQGDAKAYETLKDLTRGKKVDHSIIKQLLENYAFDASTKNRLQKLEAKNYIGAAITLTQQWLKQN
jgi:adenylosuccinate lyase